MATSNDKVYVEIIAKTSEAVKGMANFAKSIAATYLSWKAFKTLVVDSFKEYMKAEVAQTRLAAAIKITGQQSTTSLRSLTNYARTLQDITNYEEEASMAAMGVLMQLGNLTERGVKEALPLLQDFASFWQMDLVQAAELFGKTLASDTNALGRYGVEIEKGLTPQQKLVRILGQLKEGVGGFSKEMANTTEGTFTQFKIQLGELEETIGGFIAKTFTPFLKTINSSLQSNSILKKSVSEYTSGDEIRASIEQLKKSAQAMRDSIAYNKEIGVEDSYQYEWLNKYLDKIEELNRALAKLPAKKPVAGGLVAPPQPGGESDVVVELTDEQKAAQALRDMWVELRKQAILYQKEIQNNRDVSIETEKTYEHVNGQLNAYNGIIEALGYVGGAVGDVANETERAAEAVKVDWVGAFETIANLTVDIAETMGAAFASGDILGGLNAIAQKLLGMMSTMALQAAFGAARDGHWGLALLFLGMAGVAAFTGGFVGAGKSSGGEGAELPRMAAGGVVTRPTLALIGESGPEAVVPLGRGGTGGTTIIVEGSIWQTEDLARAVAGAMGRW